MALQTINAGELMSVIRGKLNTNNTLVELLENKVNVIGITPSATKYPSEKAVSDFASKIHSSASIPTTKSGDLILHQNATPGSNATKGKLKYNSGGSLQEFVPDRSVCDYRSSSSLSSTTPLLGEITVESDTGKMKIGNGSSPYSALAYLTASASDPGGGGSITYGGNASGSNITEYQNGWIKFPNGLIMQWGLDVYNANGYNNFDKAITLPVAFSQKRIYSHAVLESGTLWNDKQILVHPRSIGNYALRFVVDGGLARDAPYELHWMAIGF